MSSDHAAADAGGCSDCPLQPGRREFVQQAGAFAMALVALGLPRARAESLVPLPVTARRRLGGNPTYPIPAQDGAQIDRDAEVILVRWQNTVYAFNLSCPHQRTALRWYEKDARFQCPKHHSKYRPDGTFISGRATRGMDRFSLSRSGDEVVVHVDQMHKEDADQAGWAAAALRI
jgi:Rieske Fe-S protein